jgi:hypothetical protein
MDIDPTAIVAIIGLVGTAILYVLQNWFTKNREMELKLYTLKVKHYEQFIKKLSEGFQTVQAEGKSTTPEFKKELDELINILWLYGSDDTLRALNAFLSSSNDENEQAKEKLQKLIYFMRKDLFKKTTLKISDIEWWRAV